MGLCDFDPIFELLFLSETVSTASQVKKLQNQFLQHNMGNGTLPKAIPAGTRPKAGGAHDIFLRCHFVFFLLQLVSSTVDVDPL